MQMNTSMPDPEETAALSHVLEGEFTFYGLISARKALPSPLSSWTYHRTGQDVSRTVTCVSSTTVPYAHDAAVLEALLLLYQDLSKADLNKHRSTSINTIGLAMTALDRRASPGPPAIVLSLERLTAARINIMYTRDAAQTSVNLTFPFLTSLSYVLNDQGRDGTDDVVYSLSPYVVSLYKTGELGTFGEDERSTGRADLMQ